ncbi:hypothetical protein N7540_002145 [Penicillium herquei]|nr:hypothetical protein N7540_002145 [Penicillium herquei]
MSDTDETESSLEDWLISRTDRSTYDPNLGFIEKLHQTCSGILTHLWKSQFRWMSPGPQKTTLREDVVNLRLWHENYPRGCLDMILGQSDPLKMNVVENLNAIGDILLSFLVNRGYSTVGSPNESVFSPNRTRRLKAQLEKAALIISSEASSTSSTDDSEVSDDAPSTAQLEKNKFERLDCYVLCLMDLVSVIKNQIYRMQNQVERPNHPIEDPFHLSQGARPFAMRIKDRFLNAPVYLVERLAEANWERHIRITAEDSSERNKNHPVLFQPGSFFHDSALGSSINAATVASYASYRSRLNVAQEFPLCYDGLKDLSNATTVKNIYAWKIVLNGSKFAQNKIISQTVLEGD